MFGSEPEEKFLKVFAVYDSKAKAYGFPFYFKEKGEALRAFMAWANNKETAVGRWPEDHALFLLGEFDNHSGKLISVKVPENMGLAQEFVREEPITFKKMEEKNVGN